MDCHEIGLSWNRSGINGAVLCSLFLQAVLLALATCRERTSNTWVSFSVYVVHLCSNSVALTTFAALIVGAHCFALDNKMPYGLWAAIMFLHLAGHDRLTAYSLHDNDLWRRSLIFLILQSSAHFLFFFHQSILRLPSRIMFCLAFIRLLAKTIRLRMGTESMMLYGDLRNGDPQNEYHRQLTIDDAVDPDRPQVVLQAHCLLDASLHLLAGYECQMTRQVLDQVRQFFNKIDSRYAFRVTEIELNFLYESFHTDGTIRKHLPRSWSILYAIIRCYDLILCVLVYSLTLSSSDDNIPKDEFNVTNFLLLGTITLEFFSYIMIFFSDWTIAAFKSGSYCEQIFSRGLFKIVPQRQRWWSIYTDSYNAAPTLVGLTRVLFRRWSETISKFNFISYSIQMPSFVQTSQKYFMRVLEESIGINNLTTRFRFVSDDWYSDQLGRFIFEAIKRRELSLEDVVTSLNNNGCATDDSFKTDVLAWHITTELLYHLRHNGDNNQNHQKDYSKHLSDYMAYLLFFKPHFGSGLKNPFKKSETAQSFIQEYIQKLKQGETFEDCFNTCNSKSLHKDYRESLRRASSKADELVIKHGEDIEELWSKVSEMWIDIMLYAATKYDTMEHVRGQLISIIWLLSFHFGFFPKSEPDSSSSKINP